MSKVMKVVSSVLVAGAVSMGAYYLVVRPMFGPGGMFRDAEVRGELVVEGSSEGSWKTPLARCQSGEHSGFYGVDLGADKVALRVVRDPVKGMQVLVRSPKSDKAAVLAAESCAGLMAEVRRTNTTYNGIRVLDGDVSFDCKMPGGGHARLTAHFEGCR